MRIETGIHGKLLTFNNDIYKFVDQNFDEKEKLKDIIIQKTSDLLTKFKERIQFIKRVRNYHQIFRPTLMEVYAYISNASMPKEKVAFLEQHTTVIDNKSVENIDLKYIKINIVDLSDISDNSTDQLNERIKQQNEQA